MAPARCPDNRPGIYSFRSLDLVLGRLRRGLGVDARDLADGNRRREDCPRFGLQVERQQLSSGDIRIGANSTSARSNDQAVAINQQTDRRMTSVLALEED